MNYLKGVLARLKRQKTKKRRLIIIASLGFPLLLLILAAAWHWRDYQAISAWEKLARQAGTDTCHDECLLRQTRYRNRILSSYEYTKPTLLDCLFGSACRQEAKQEALGLLQSAEPDICQTEIPARRSSLSRLDQDSFLLIYQACDLALSPADLRLAAFWLKEATGERRADILRLLAIKAPSAGLASALTEAKSGADQSEAISILAWLKGQGKAISASDLDALCRDYRATANESLLRRLVFLVGDYYSNYPLESRQCLEAVINGPHGTVSRALAANILAAQGVAGPAISLREEDLDE